MNKETKKLFGIFSMKKQIESNDIINEEMFDKISKMKQEKAINNTKLLTLAKQLECKNTILKRREQMYFPFSIIELTDSINEDNENKIKVEMNDDKAQAHFALYSSN